MAQSDGLPPFVHICDRKGSCRSDTDARGVIVTYAYNAIGGPTTVTYPGGSVTYAYDDAGRLQHKQAARGDRFTEIRRPPSH